MATRTAINIPNGGSRFATSSTDAEMLGSWRAETVNSMLGPSESQTMPMFSVCLPTYNRGYCLANAIQSVLDQDFDDYELLICDDASTDNTRAIIQSFDDRRIRTHFWPERGGIYANHNRCIGDALGPWVVFLHSDDQLVPSALASYAQLITQFPNAALFYPRNSMHAMIADSAFPVVLDGQLGLPFILRCPAGALLAVAFVIRCLRNCDLWKTILPLTWISSSDYCFSASR